MPDRITLYVSDEVKLVLEEFKALLSETSLSSVFADCVRARVDAAKRSRKVATQQKNTEQEVELENESGLIVSKKVFKGISVGGYLAEMDFDGNDTDVYWDVYLTAKGAVVGVIQGYGELGFRVYRTVEEFQEDEYAPAEAKRALAELTDEPYTEYLDI